MHGRELLSRSNGFYAVKVHIIRSECIGRAAS